VSKNFELMQEVIAMEQEGIPPSGNGRAVPFTDREYIRRSSGMALDLVTREESLKLAQRLFLGQAEKRLHVVVFAGIDPGNGCSRLCGETARALADSVPGTICLVDGNLRAPSLPEYFGVMNHWGLTDALLQKEPIRDFAKPVYRDNLWLLTSGSLAEAHHALNSERLKTRFDELRKDFDYVLVDAPPLNHYADASVLGQIADGVVLVLEANSTRRESALKAIEALRSVQIDVLGAVLNKRTFPVPESVYRRL
jgi:capsular exopolysaccharide synthesis family protein